MKEYDYLWVNCSLAIIIIIIILPASVHMEVLGPEVKLVPPQSLEPLQSDP